MVARLFTALLLAALVEEGATAQTSIRARLIVVVPRDSVINEISQSDLRRIFLGEITRWPDGHRIVPVVLDPVTGDGGLFLRRVLRMTDIDYAQHWIGQVFQGQAAAPPRVVRTVAEAKRYVAEHRYAIAVIPRDALDGSLKVLAVDGKPIDAVDYPLAW